MSFVRDRNHDLKGLSTQDVVTKIVIPETSDTKVRYVDLIPNSAVSVPNYFASHVWSSPFLDLVESLSQYILLDEADEESKSVFVWIDIFAVKQHRSADQANDLKNLHEAIKNSKISVLVCLDSNLKLLTRYHDFFTSALT